MPENSHPVLRFTQQAPKHTKCKVSAYLAPSTFYSAQALHLVDESGATITANLRALSLWPNKSIKWLLIEAHLTKALEPNACVYVKEIPNHYEKQRKDWVKAKQNGLQIKTPEALFHFEPNKFCTLTLQSTQQVTLCKVCNPLAFVDAKHSVNNVSTEYEIVYDSQENPLVCHVKQKANLRIITDTSAQDCVEIHAHFSIFYHDSSVRLNLKIHNTKAIVPAGGKWDLGNDNSLYIQHLRLCFDYSSQQQHIRLANETSPQAFNNVELVQCSSGGENWDSLNHKNRHNKVGVSKKGAFGKLRIKSDNKETQQAIEVLRATPQLSLHLADYVLKICPENFWQTFPNGLRASNSRTLLDFADAQSECEVELQAGEIKSSTLWFSLGEQASSACFAYTPHIALCKVYENEPQTQVQHIYHALPFIDKSLSKHPLLNLADNKTQQQDIDSWLAKREALDEYGWRNFGDLYADHEAAHHKGDDIFVSHYNNQYDPLFGFLKKWLISGNAQYKQLADELFEHIANIDIYHTNGDKPDYNRGMFWHTDHYVKAETSSHRTYSRHQEANVYMDHISGGGPGPHHCYSSGLAFYYLLTGKTEARDITLGLFGWMRHIYEGDGTLLGLLLRVKNANYLKIPFTNKLLLGFGTGVLRNVFTNQYPLDRGTGNYLNLMLDCFMITHQLSYLVTAERVILNTIREQDDITQRNFENIETTWFYTVFLQAVARYLSTVSEQTIDATESNAISSDSAQIGRIIAIKKAFLHYVEWMALHETIYLDNKDVLEYPNDTWTAQDLRKLHLLWCGYELSKNEQMRDKAQSLADKIIPMLQQSDELSYTRLQALIMQNAVLPDSIKHQFAGIEIIETKAHGHGSLRVNKSWVNRFASFVKHYSISREINFLCARIPAFKKVFKR